MSVRNNLLNTGQNGLTKKVTVAIIRPDEQHETRRSPEGDDEGAEDGQNHEVGEDPVTAAFTWTLARPGCQVDWSTFSHTPAIIKHLQTKAFQFVSCTYAISRPGP